jgi:diguanylate cyclase (GGDEF)-like protein
LRYSDNLVYAEISQRDRMLALWVGGAAVVLTIASAPIARLAGGEIVSFLPSVYAVAIFAELLTAFLLWNQYRASGHPPIAVLALAYAGTAVLGAEYVLTFPHAFADHFLGSGSQSAIWLYFVGHVFFATYVILFAVWEPLCRRSPAFARGNGVPMLAAITALVPLIALVVTVGYAEDLPVAIVGERVTRLWAGGIIPALLSYLVLACAVLVIATRLRTAVHVWLAVILAISLSEVLLSSIISDSRFTLGWYLGRGESLVAASVFLVVLFGSVYRILLTLTSTNATLYRQSVSDELTGLLNRRGFNTRLEEELRRAQRRNEAVALLVIDIDDFKCYNDSYGHPAGDSALGIVARVIKTTLRRAADCSARIGGEEFAVLLPETDQAGAAAVAQRIRRGVERIGILQGAGARHGVLTVSLGVASTDERPALDGLDLMRRADRALYAAKSDGRNCAHVEGALRILPGESSLAV